VNSGGPAGTPPSELHPAPETPITTAKIQRRVCTGATPRAARSPRAGACTGHEVEVESPDQPVNTHLSRVDDALIVTRVPHGHERPLLAVQDYQSQ